LPELASPLRLRAQISSEVRLNHSSTTLMAEVWPLTSQRKLTAQLSQVT